MNVVVISGSPRKNSNTLRVSKAVKMALEQLNYPVDLIDMYEHDIPLPNRGSVSIDDLTDFQSKLVAAWNNAKLVIILTPEYNWFPSADIINLFNQFGDTPFKHLFDKKVFAFGAVSSGRGGRIPAIHLSYMVSKLVSFMDCTSIVSSKILENQFVTQALNEYGISTGNELYDQSIRQFVDYNSRLAAMIP